MKLSYNSKTIDLPIHEATEGLPCVDISNIEKEFGVYTFDPAFMSTASCESKITFIDGDKGVLAHRGYAIESLFGNTTFLELFFLLMTGSKKAESVDEFHRFRDIALNNLQVSQSTVNVLKSFKTTDHPMSMLMGMFSHISAFHTKWNPDNAKQTQDDLTAAFGEFLGCIVLIYRYIKGKTLEIKKTNHFTETLCLNMFDESHFKTHKKELEDVINKLFVLHADHEQNASTSTVRMVASTDVSPYAAIVAGVAALWGPLHGGANEAVINMLAGINSVKDVASYIEKVKTKEVKLMGFGHRVYKNYDPRAKLIKQSCDSVLDIFSKDNKEGEKLAIARALEQAALQDDYFVSRKLFPNVDFYSGIIYKALDIPPQFFTAMFAAARIAGWCSQMNEFYSEPRKISRPRQLYIGKKVL